MSRSAIFVLVAIFCGVLLFRRLSPTPDPVPEVLSTEQIARAPAKAPPTATPTQQQQELSELQQKLLQAQEKRATQAQALANLKQVQPSSESPRSYRSQISRRDVQIRNLLDTLSSYQDAEEDLNQAAAASLQNQDSAARVARDQLDLQIQQIQEAILRTQNELAYLQTLPPGIDTGNIRAQSEQLQTQLADQQNQFNALRNQRVEISAGVFNNSSNIHTLAEQARNELRSSALQTQDQIFSLRSEIDRLQAVQDQARTEGSAKKSEQAQLEKDLEAQDQAVKALQLQIQEQEAKLGTN